MAVSKNETAISYTCKKFKLMDKQRIIKIIPYIVLFGLMTTSTVIAQTRKGEFINASVGLGISDSYDEVDITGSGFYIQGEYVFGLREWFSVRPYAGFVTTSKDDDDFRDAQLPYEVTASAFLMGGKVRVLAPIPWVAPYIELGIGASIGSFTTFTPLTNIEENGLLLHIPFTVGIEIGRTRRFAAEFVYYFHPSAEQVLGAAAIGITIPIKT
ncbi:hypothetical protein J8281_16070 [Aquimarina sp. U1-2]|uniref:hypothetical protein n=1 Tax=Aquimarina sp. U1-2 TaxID=2823141 RepID=UPI001AECA3AD|nr:hypothetical protein [Aquimarina sp. U1-2]MBP2833712.1 hypothetical protein [Aquimarina sp. U1-2]